MHRATLPIVLALAAGLAGCAARRTLTITSDPPGAFVRIDDDPVGATPLELRFDHYGTREIVLRKEGYLAHRQLFELDTPWYFHFPLDYVTELLLPFGFADRHELYVELRAGDETRKLPYLRSVLERAEILRRAGPEGPRELPEPELEPAETTGPVPPS